MAVVFWTFIAGACRWLARELDPSRDEKKEA